MTAFQRLFSSDSRIKSTSSYAWMIFAGSTAAGAAAVVLTPVILATVSQLRSWWFAPPERIPVHSALYKGRVWHTRYLPLRHQFSYPIFLFRIDLEELSGLQRLWWPLTWIMRLDENDHLKNREGYLRVEGEENSANTTLNDKEIDNSLLCRVLRLVTERTKHHFQPTRETHRVLLLTQLRYYGYCFNPVSFYYIINRQSHQVEAVVGEVSNTPWLEMHAYVLHPDSVDQVTVNKNSDQNNNTMHYVFPKTFHVSPFMEMTYWYDWTFSPQLDNQAKRIRVINAMQVRHTQEEDDDDGTTSTTTSPTTIGPLQFRATLQMDRYSLQSPYAVVPSLIVYPMFGMIVQGWIHYQALWLFLKGVAFCPHPQGAETTASRVIATIMTPVFAVKEMWSERKEEQTV